MALIVVGTEKNFAALRPRIVTGRVSTAAVHQITDAIAAANPHVDLKALTPGTILTIPDVPHVSVQGDVSLDDTTKQAFANLVTEGGNALEQLAATARETEAAAADERKALAKTLTGKDLDAAARADKALAADLKATQQAVADEEQAAKTRSAELDAALADWNAELKALQGVVP
jgi:hypothetical protein